MLIVRLAELSLVGQLRVEPLLAELLLVELLRVELLRVELLGCEQTIIFEPVPTMDSFDVMKSPD